MIFCKTTLKDYRLCTEKCAQNDRFLITLKVCGKNTFPHTFYGLQILKLS